MNMFGPRQVAPAPEIGWVGRSQILGDCAGSPGGCQGLGLLPYGRELQCDSGVAPFDLAPELHVSRGLGRQVLKQGQGTLVHRQRIFHRIELPRELAHLKVGAPSARRESRSACPPSSPSSLR